MSSSVRFHCFRFMRFVSSHRGFALVAALILGSAASCRSPYVERPGDVEASARPGRGGRSPAASPMDDAIVAASFRVLLDEVIGDSADRVCLSVTDPGAPSPHLPDDAIDRDPSEETLRRLRGTRVVVMARSVCAADERNFGPSRGHLRLRNVIEAPDHSLTIDAEAMGQYFARYQCVGVYELARVRSARCRLTGRE